MNKFMLILLFCVTGYSVAHGQTEVRETYFHELKGVEDSSGVSHLFYRLFIKGKYECTGDNPEGSPSIRENDVYHYNLHSKTDSVLFADYYEEWCLTGVVDSKSIISFSFYEKNPEKWIITGAYENALSITDYTGRSLDFEVATIAVKTNSHSSTLTYVPVKIMLSPNGDSLYVKTFSDYTIPFPGNSEEWPIFEDNETFNEYADSLAIEWNIIGIHPDLDSLYFAVNSSGDLYRSTHFSSDFTFTDSTKYFRNLFFDADTSHVYALNSAGILRSNDLGKADSWEFIEIDFSSNASRYFSIDDSISGHLFVSDSTEILFSNNYGDSFSSLLSLENEITGLYKKPDSNILYVLTREELLEVNTETKETTTLKKIPVSNEREPGEIPREITLHQNYPNPFNPSTVISYQLAVNSLVRLEVFDVTGREVAVLVDGEVKTAGRHEVTFDAAEFSSGMYFYRLVTGGITLTQKMILLK